MEKHAKKLEELANILGEILVPTKLTNIVTVPIMAVQKGMLEVAEELRNPPKPEEESKDMPPWGETAAGSPEHEEART